MIGTPDRRQLEPDGGTKSGTSGRVACCTPGRMVRSLDAREVDERDSSWEDSSPLFRVYLFDRGDGADYYATETWDLAGVDVLDAVRWAQERSGDDRLYALALVRDERLTAESDPSRGLVWLVGMDWFDNVDGDPEGQRIKKGMVARRGRMVISGEPL